MGLSQGSLLLMLCIQHVECQGIPMLSETRDCRCAERMMRATCVHLGPCPQRPFKAGRWRNGTKKDFDFWSTERECFRLSCSLKASWSATTNNTSSPTISKKRELEVRRSYL